MRSLFFLVAIVLAVCLPPYLMNNQNGNGVPQNVKDNLVKDSSSLLGDIADLGKSIFSSKDTTPQTTTPQFPSPASQIYDNGKVYVKIYEPGYGWKYVPNPYNEYWKGKL
jgi:hypothetical protein